MASVSCDFFTNMMIKIWRGGAPPSPLRSLIESNIRGSVHKHDDEKRTNYVVHFLGGGGTRTPRPSRVCRDGCYATGSLGPMIA